MGESAQGVGVIAEDELYTLEAFASRVGFGEHAMKSARDAGLKVRYRSRRAFVLGRDAIEFFAAAPVVRDGKGAGDA